MCVQGVKVLDLLFIKVSALFNRTSDLLLIHLHIPFKEFLSSHESILLVSSAESVFKTHLHIKRLIEIPKRYLTLLSHSRPLFYPNLCAFFHFFLYRVSVEMISIYKTVSFYWTKIKAKIICGNAIRRTRN